MARRLSRISAVMQKEMLHIFRDNIAFMIAFLAPILLGALVSFLYVEQKVTGIPVAVYDQDQSETSRLIIRSFADSERFKITRVCNSYAEVEHLLQSEKVQMGIMIPPHLQKDIKAGVSSEVGLVFNSTNLLTMNTLANAASAVVQTISAGITMKVMQGYGVAPQKAYQAVTALNFRTRYWYNPTLSYLVFMVLGLFGTVLQQVTFLGVALSFSREKENGTWRQLACSKLRAAEIIGGKLSVYFIIYSINALILYGAGFSYFGLPMRGNVFLFLGTVLLFIFVLLAMGMAISIVAASTPQAIEISMLIAVPSFLISGWTWPLASMPWPLQFLSRLLPLSYFLEAIRRIAFLGAGLEVVWPEILVLFLMAAVCIPLTGFVLNRQLTGD